MYVVFPSCILCLLMYSQCDVKDNGGITNNEDRVSIAIPGYVYSKGLCNRIVTTVASVI